MRPMSPSARAYVAAMIDAEGVVTISRHSGGAIARKNNREPCYRPVVIVTNSHAGLIGFLAEVAGEGIVYQNPKPPRPNWSPMHRWQCMNAAAQRLLEPILPYLVIKREIAALVMKLQPIPKKAPFAERPALRAVQADLFEQVKRLNTRGAGSHRATMTLEDFPADHPLLL